jgi:hypothetical protein
MARQVSYHGLHNQWGVCSVIFQIDGMEYEYEMDCRKADTAHWLTGKSVWKALNYAKKHKWKERKRRAGMDKQRVAQELLAAAKELVAARQEAPTFPQFLLWSVNGDGDLTFMTYVPEGVNATRGDVLKAFEQIKRQANITLAAFDRAISTVKVVFAPSSSLGGAYARVILLTTPINLSTEELLDGLNDELSRIRNFVKVWRG